MPEPMSRSRLDASEDPRNVRAADTCRPCRYAMGKAYAANQRGTLPNDVRCKSHAK